MLGHVMFLGSKPQELVLSQYWVDVLDEAEVRDTILHEIAHVLAGIRAGHGPAWKDVARSLGARPEACASPKARIAYRYKLVCPKCGELDGGFHRRPTTKYAHMKCGTPLKVVDTRTTGTYTLAKEERHG